MRLVKIAKTWLILLFQNPKWAFISFLLQVSQHASLLSNMLQKTRERHRNQGWPQMHSGDPAWDLRGSSAVPNQRTAAGVQWLERTKAATSSYRGPEWWQPVGPVALVSHHMVKSTQHSARNCLARWEKQDLIRNQVWGLREELWAWGSM